MKQRGRPSLGKVVWKHRVKPELVSALDDVFYGRADSKIRELESKLNSSVESETKLQKDLDALQVRFDRAVAATQDQLAAYWKREYLKLKEMVGKKSEFDQT